MDSVWTQPSYEKFVFLGAKEQKFGAENSLAA
jgi:hypothetical protein